MAHRPGLWMVGALVWVLAGCVAGTGGAGPATVDAPQESGRLRYKGEGPPCMCQSGLSEEDIQPAQDRQGE